MTYDIHETSAKPNHYTTVIGNFKAQIGTSTNLTETTTSEFGLEIINERVDTLIEWSTSRHKN